MPGTGVCLAVRRSEPDPQARAARIATQVEINQAVEALSQEDAERLEAYAKNRIVGIGRRAANGRTYEDLLQEAMLRVQDGRRHWYPPNVTFAHYLLRVMESIASEWAGHHERNPGSPEYAALESQLVGEDEEGNTIPPIQGVRRDEPNAEQQMVNADTEAERKALADEIEARFADDENASYVLMAWQEGMDGPAIRQTFGFSETTFETVRRRIKRNAQKVIDKHHGQ